MTFEDSSPCDSPGFLTGRGTGGHQRSRDVCDYGSEGWGFEFLRACQRIPCATWGPLVSHPEERVFLPRGLGGCGIGRAHCGGRGLRVDDSSSSGRANESLDSQWVSAAGAFGGETEWTVLLPVLYPLAPNTSSAIRSAASDCMLGMAWL